MRPCTCDSCLVGVLIICSDDKGRPIDQLRRERLSSNVLVVGVNFGGHFGGQNGQVSMGQNGMVTSCVQSAEQIGSKKFAIGNKFECLPVTILFEPICSADCTQLVTIPFWPILTCTFCPPKWPPKLTPTTNTFVVIMAL